MSQHRIRPDAGWGVPKDHPRGPNGRYICRCGCGVEVPRGRRTFASPDCVHRYKIETDPGYVRHLVWCRDKGVCCLCGLDTDRLRREVTDRGSVWYRTPEQRGRLEAMGFDPRAYQAGDFWQADHATPVVEGGGGCGLEGYRTLCTPCHKRETAALAKRLAARRRAEREAARQPLLPEP